MAKISIQLEVKTIVPILDAFVFYFNTKYPCTDKTNDGSSMSIDDELKLLTYNHLLSVYNKTKKLYQSEYKEMKNQYKKMKKLSP